MAPDFELYRVRSREVQAVLRSAGGAVEVVGLDEAYLDLSGLRAAAYGGRAAGQGGGPPADRARLLDRASGPSKLVAKVASDAEKPDGFVELTAEQARERFGAASPRPGARHRPQDRGAAGARGVTRLGALGALADARLTEMVRAAPGPAPGRAGPLRGRARH